MNRMNVFRRTTTVATAVGLTGAATLLLLTTGGGAANAAEGPVAPSLTPALTSQLSAFRNPTQAPAETQSDLATRFARSAGNSDDPLAKADWSQARPSVVQGSGGLAWTVPAGDEICLLVPMPEPTTPYGVQCSTAAEVAAGLAVQVIIDVADPDEDAIVAAIVPDGAAATTTDGSSTVPLPVTNNVTTTVVDSNDTVRVGKSKVVIDDLY